MSRPSPVLVMELVSALGVGFLGVIAKSGLMAYGLVALWPCGFMALGFCCLYFCYSAESSDLLPGQFYKAADRLLSLS